MPSGYSGTPLAKKLGVKEGFVTTYYKKPDYYFELFDDFPLQVTEVFELDKENVDFIHVFCTTMEELERILPEYKNALKKNGLLWVSWPKGSSKIPTDLKREPIRAFVLSIGLVDVKVCAVDADWSGLKFVYRVKDR